MAKILIKGNEAVGAAMISAGCKTFFAYPITPQSEVPEYLARELPKVGGTFVQAESEVAAINMLYGSSGTGTRVATSSSSPGVALMQEGISYLAGAELPCMIVNMMRGGPGLGSIQPSQTDYFQSVKGGGNGDYKTITLAPASIQEMVNLIHLGFDLADLYRIPVILCGDGMLGQMMEPVEFTEYKGRELPAKDWAATGTKKEREPNIINSLFLEPEDLEEHNLHLMKKYAEINEKEVLVETIDVEDADIVFTAFGTTSRICRTAGEILKEKGYKVGYIRPITLWPFPSKAYDLVGENTKLILDVELNQGQMVEDVRLAVNGRLPVEFYGRTGGMIPTAEEIAEAALKYLEA
ncbi:MAG: 3-methyl-2-oxobutanoate dehydrogenase subunit VorB [Tissierellia bacterium]|nr:3-methyl-2-oxobutanoate dehydrogenase subunit VorB [Tissierellia bacterium]